MDLECMECADMFNHGDDIYFSPNENQAMCYECIFSHIKDGECEGLWKKICEDIVGG